MSNLFTDDFELGSAAGWKQKIQFELNGADYASTLLTPTNEGIAIKPFYHSDTFEKVLVPSIKSDFKTCHSILILNEQEALTEALNALEHGINSLKFYAQSPFEIETLFKELIDKQLEFHFHLDFLATAFINELSTFLSKETVYLNIDIIGNLAKTGNWHTNLNSDFKALETIIKQNVTHFSIGVNAEIYQNAGANAVQQVAYALAHAQEYIHAFGAEITDKIQFNFAIGSNYFFEIAKIRAFRYLFQLICSEYDTNCNPPVFTEPSARNKTYNNLNINNVRSYTEHMSGVLGSSNTIATAIKLNNSLKQLTQVKADFSNISLNDLTFDNYYIESITKQIAEKALVIFKEIEKGGGFLHQLKEGTLQRKITENAKKEQTQFDTKEIVLIGANKNIESTAIEELKFIKNPYSIKNSRKTLIIPIVGKRLSEKLEQKQLKNEA